MITYKVRPELGNILLSWYAWQTCHLLQKLDLKSFFIWSVWLLSCHWVNPLTNYRQTQGCSRSKCARLKVNKYKGCMCILIRRIKQHYYTMELLNTIVTIILLTSLIFFLYKSNNLERARGFILKIKLYYIKERSVFKWVWISLKK